MSARHRQSQAGSPSIAKADKEDRRLDHRKERHAARKALTVSDPDEIVMPVLHHAAGHSAPEAASKKPFRHWKQPFWKRRSALAHQRNVELDRIVRLP